MVKAVPVAEEDLLRARFYGLLAALLASPPDTEMLSRLRQLEGDDSPMGEALTRLSQAAADASHEQVVEEWNALFIGVTRGEVLPYASYYLTGFLNEKPLAVLREDMAQLGIARREGVPESEDHIVSLLEMMRGMIEGSFGEPFDLGCQKTFFEKHLKPWAGRFFADLETAGEAKLYRPVGAVGRLLMQIEGEAFEMM
ncbi:molecular chaperone [Telmatospirillum sp. J64-1]|uniref:TorD/DmsD family molecular chaperone n=1 Tax=Telmatospirillum sp. J64-1 TaxID=2502183 RepID=UPI0021063C54|nr:molecular chaperone TorD family protein [Telmatospirillum sp. J64-1]